MDTSGDRPPARADGGMSSERKGPPRTAPEGKRRRPSESRYAGWGDGIERAFCARAEHVLPSTFPVASHAGLAVIAPKIVARRPDALLLCTFSHVGSHVWPDGEVADDAPDEPSTAAT